MTRDRPAADLAAGEFYPRVSAGGLEDDMGKLKNRKEIFGRFAEDGLVAVLYTEGGAPVTRLDTPEFPEGSSLGCRYEHPEGIRFTRAQARRLGILVERR